MLPLEAVSRNIIMLHPEAELNFAFMYVILIFRAVKKQILCNLKVSEKKVLKVQSE